MVIVKEVKIWKAGGSWVITVPMAYIENGLVKENTKYSIDINEEVEEVAT